MGIQETGRQYFEQKLMRDPTVGALGKHCEEITPVEIRRLPQLPHLRRLGGPTLDQSRDRGKLLRITEDFLNRPEVSFSSDI